MSIPERPLDRDRFRRLFLLLLVTLVSLLFLAMIRSMLIVLLLAAIFSALAYPLYRRLLRWTGGRKAAASALTLLVVLLLVIVPLLLFLGIVAGQALGVSQQVGPWVSEQIRQFEEGEGFLNRFAVIERLEPYRDQIMSKLGEFAGRAGTWLFNALSATTKGTVSFFFQLSVMLYAMFFFLMDGPEILARILSLIPLDDRDKERMADKFVSVTRAMLKGTFLIGVLQGALAGLAFHVVGIEGAVFWGTVMVVLSVIPVIGTPLVWIPAVIILLANGRYGAGLGLLAWCGIVVGSVDNFLRPTLVGKDVKMPDLMIFLGTLGGIFFFGAVGFLLGPIVAALFVSVWDMFGVAFRDALGDGERRGSRRRRRPSGRRKTPPHRSEGAETRNADRKPTRRRRRPPEDRPPRADADPGGDRASG
jgi:predicted PurR-regulated permease PerM